MRPAPLREHRPPRLGSVVLPEDLLELRDDLRREQRRLRGLVGVIENSFSAASQLLIDCLYECGPDGAIREPFFASNNIALEHSEYSTLGGCSAHFRKAAAEDREFCRRWMHSGRPLVSCGKRPFVILTSTACRRF